MEEYNYGIWEAPQRIVYDDEFVAFGGNYETEGESK